MWKYIPAMVLAIIALFCALTAIPTRGGVNANVFMIFPAGGFGVLALIAAVLAWAI